MPDSESDPAARLDDLYAAAVVELMHLTKQREQLREALNLLAPVIQWLVSNYPKAWVAMPTGLFQDFQRASKLIHTEMAQMKSRPEDERG